MNEQWKKIREGWSHLALREKRIVLIGTPLAGIFILYQCIWSPLINAASHMRHRIQSEQQLLAFMQMADKEIMSRQGQTKNKMDIVTPVELLGILQKQINQSGLHPSLSQLKQASNDSISIQFQKVDFDKFMQLLLKISQEQAISVTQMSATTNTKAGIANVEMIIKM